MFPVTLRGQRVTLREFTAEDFPAVHSYGGDPEVTRYTLWGPNEPEDTRGFLAWAMQSARAEPRTDYSLAAQVDGELVGGAHLAILSGVHAAGDIGYVLRRDRWGEGLAQEAARLVLRLGFQELGLHRVQATCDPQNAASRHVLERIGMRQEGHLRENFLVRGRWRDSLLYAVLRGEWEADLR